MPVNQRMIFLKRDGIFFAHIKTASALFADAVLALIAEIWC